MKNESYIVHGIHPTKPENNFRHVFTADSDYSAAHVCAELVRQAYVEQQIKEPMVFTLVVLLENFDVPPKAWSVKLPEGHMEPCDVPCGYCGGTCGVDSGGVTPEGRGIEIPCPACKDGCEHAIQLRAWQEAFGTSQLSHALAENQAYGKSLTNFQNQVWGDLDKYSKKLGWGLTGIQPECWALLDAAVDELVKAREIIKTTRTAIHVPADKPDDFLPKAAEMLMGMYEASQPKPRTT